MIFLRLITISVFMNSHFNSQALGSVTELLDRHRLYLQHVLPVHAVLDDDQVHIREILP
jgi:hypothetical protein